jgi:alkaline phosphatase
VLVIALAFATAYGAEATTKPPKNIVVMISDGCGYNQVEATSLYLHGKAGALPFESFPVIVGMSTYMAGQGYDPCLAWRYFNTVKLSATDSAAAATAMAAGMKTYGGAIGVTIDGKRAANVVERAEELGKSTGVITSVQFSHATPAAFVAHKASRGDYVNIAKEMICESAVDVIMGCGNPFCDNSGGRLIDGETGEPKEDYNFVGGKDTWDALAARTAGGDADGDGQADPWLLVQTREKVRELGSGEVPDRVICIPMVGATLQQARPGNGGAAPYEVPLTESVPTLVEMTKAALNVLDNDPDGLFLMIEGGAIDWACHANQAGRMIEEEIDFSNAVGAVIEWVETHSSWEETLVIVTGDHETGYLTGPGSGTEGPTWKPLVNNGKGKLPGVQWHSGGHTNSLIPLYAKGCGADLFRFRANRADPFRGPYVDNTDVAKVIFDLWLWD